MIFKKQAEEDFNIQAAEFPEMEALINRCANIYMGVPEWLDDKNNIKTINFAKSVCSETARLATLAISKMKRGKDARGNLVEEIADVLICIETLKQLYDVDTSSLNDWIRLKQQRELNRIEFFK